MSVYVNDRYRIRRSADQEQQMKFLTDKRIFPAYANILTLSAVIGFRNNQYIPISKPASDAVLMQFFTEEDRDLIDIIAYCHSRNQNILKSDEKYEIFENYANGGFPILMNKLDLDLNADVIDIKNVLTHLYTVLVLDQITLDKKDILDDILL